MIRGGRGRVEDFGAEFVGGVFEVVEDFDAEFVGGAFEVVEDFDAEFVGGAFEVVEDFDAEFVGGGGGDVDGPPCMSHERSRAERSR
jgi:RNase P/RNase MRP subunit p29